MGSYNALFMLVAGLIFSLPAHAQNRYANDEYGFTIDFPAGWLVKGSAAENTVIKAVHKDAQGRIALIAVAAYPLDVKADIWDSTGQDIFEGFLSEYPGVEAALLDSGKTIIGDEHALWTDIDVKAPPLIAMHSLSYHIFQKPILYRISYSSDRDARWFQTHLPAARVAIRSFRLRLGIGGSPHITVSRKGDSFVVALFKGYWQTFLMVLAAGIGVGIAKALMSRVRRRRESASTNEGRQEDELESPAADTPTGSASALGSMAKRCPVCRHENPGDAQFCARCGDGLQGDAAPIIVNRRRPRSLAIVSIIIIIFFGGGYVVGIALLLSGAQEFTLSRLIVEPPESEGGIPWPGWDRIGKMLRGELPLPPFDPNNLAGMIEVVEARYWWSKLKTAGSLLVGPFFVLGWIGVYIGREWGRVCLYVYASVWLANKVIYLLLMGAEGVFKFSLAVGMAVLLVLVLRSKSWSAWIASSSTVSDDSIPANT